MTSRVQRRDSDPNRVAAATERHSRVPAGCGWSWRRAPISCAGWGRSSWWLPIRVCPGSAAHRCAPQPPWPHLHTSAAAAAAAAALSLPNRLWRKRDSAGLHSAQIPPSAGSGSRDAPTSGLRWNAQRRKTPALPRRFRGKFGNFYSPAIQRKK